MPSCEILCVGTELLLGQIVNTNSQYLSAELAGIGVDCYYQTTVGDNRARIIASVKQALTRADVLLITGGLGPTADDLTSECLAEAFAVPMLFEQSVLDALEAFFKTRGYPMPASNRKQALRPEGSIMLPNPHGTAPGIIWEVWPQLLRRAGIDCGERTCTIITFPGVPGEMKAMWRQTARPYLAEKYGEGVVWSIDLKHYGIGESLLAEKYGHLLENDNPTVAPYAGTGECKLRVTAKAKTESEAQRLAQPIVDEIIRDSGVFFYGTNDDTLEVVVGRLLHEAGKTLTVAESCTGGLVSQRLTDVPGSSAYIKLNLVTYANESKEKLLGVPASVLAAPGAVSQPCAEAMAEGARRLSAADLGLSITGIAGPDGGTPDKPVGLVYIALSDKAGTAARKLTFPSQLSRQEIRSRSSSEALNMVRLHLRGDS